MQSPPDYEIVAKVTTAHLADVLSDPSFHEEACKDAAYVVWLTHALTLVTYVLKWSHEKVG